MTRRTQQLSRFAVLAQGLMWGLLLLIFLIVLPGYGIAGPADLNDPAKVRAAAGALMLVNWIYVGFGLSLLIILYVLYQHLRLRMPLLLRGLVAILIFGAALWFILHDLGFHIRNWADIERDPAGTNFAADTTLWAFRNAAFFVFGLLIYKATMDAAKAASPPHDHPLITPRNS